MNNTTLNRDEQILSLYNEGLTIKEIAKETGLTYEQVRYRRRKFNMELYIITIKCDGCSESFDTTSRHAKYCSEYCRLKTNKATILQKNVECLQCSKQFKTYKNKYCSDNCRRIAKLSVNTGKVFNQLRVIDNARRLHLKRCIDCNDTMTTTYRNRTICTDCGIVRKKKRYELSKKRYNIKCKECSQWFDTKNHRKYYCSTECGKRYSNRLKETKRRKKILSNGDVHWDISIERLLKRDGHQCYLCNEKVIKHKNKNHDKYPNIEHVIPIAKGGTHTWDNVKVAHRKCNMEKGTKQINSMTPGLKQMDFHIQ